MTRLVALTGNIGSGKSYVSTLFARIGVPVFYSDTEAKKMYYNDDIRNTLTQRYGNGIYLDDGTINKPFLSKLIFGDRHEAVFIESLLYPALNRHFMQWAQGQGTIYVVYESAIIFEKHMDSLFDAIVTVAADEATRLRRVMLRDDCDEDSVRHRMRTQWSDAFKTEHSDYVIIHNHDNEDEYLESQVIDIHNQLCNRYKAYEPSNESQE